MDQLLGDAKRLIQRLNHHDNCADILISEMSTLESKMRSMYTYKDEVTKMNEIANHRSRSTLALGSQLENQRIQNLVEENRELSISLAEHQSALELIMKKYREHVVLTTTPKSFEVVNNKNTTDPLEMVFMKERMAEMARIMWESATIDDSREIREMEFVRKLQVENENLRELLEISGENLPHDSLDMKQHINHESQLISDPSGQDIMTSTESYILSKIALLKTNDSLKLESVPNEVKNYNSASNMLPNDFDNVKKRSKKRRMPGNSEFLFEINDVGNNLDHVNMADNQNIQFSDNQNLQFSDNQHIKNLEQLFKGPASHNEDATDHPSSRHHDTQEMESPEMEDYASDPSNSCFRAIISDIQPLDFNIINEKLYEYQSPDYSQESETSETNTYPRNDQLHSLADSENEDTLSESSEASVIENLNMLIDMASNDNDKSLDEDVDLDQHIDDINEASVLEDLDMLIEMATIEDDPLLDEGLDSDHLTDTNGSSIEENVDLIIESEHWDEKTILRKKDKFEDTTVKRKIEDTTVKRKIEDTTVKHKIEDTTVKRKIEDTTVNTNELDKSDQHVDNSLITRGENDNKELEALDFLDEILGDEIDSDTSDVDNPNLDCVNEQSDSELHGSPTISSYDDETNTSINNTLISNEVSDSNLGHNTTLELNDLKVDTTEQCSDVSVSIEGSGDGSNSSELSESLNTDDINETLSSLDFMLDLNDDENDDENDDQTE